MWQSRHIASCMERAAGGPDALAAMELDDMEAIWQQIKKDNSGNGT